MKYLITIVLVFTALCQVKAQTFNGNKKDIKTILKNTETFSKHLMASDYEMIADSYTDDAKIFPNNTKILEGEDIIEYWRLPEGFSTPYHRITQTEITVIKDIAYDYGYYEGKTRNTKGEVKSWKGKYVIVWKKKDDVWKMYLDIWNKVNTDNQN